MDGILPFPTGKLNHWGRLRHDQGQKAGRLRREAGMLPRHARELQCRTRS
jgi:hypothetical protein